MSKTPKLVVEGRLRFATATDINVRAETPLGTFNLFKILFAKDGSIFVPFPYLQTKRGLLSETDPATEPDPKTVQLRRKGVVVEYDAKSYAVKLNVFNLFNEKYYEGVYTGHVLPGTPRAMQVTLSTKF